MNQERDILFEELVGRHIDLVFYMAKSWCHCSSWAEDLAQESFLKAYANFDQFTPGTNFKAWILKILRNVYLDAKKKHRPQPSDYSWDDLVEGKENLDGDYPSEIAEIVDIENQKILYDLFSEEIAHSLQKLPKRQQICLLLCDVEGLTYQEIADVMGCPVGTVRSSIHRGRMLFYSYVQDYARKMGFKESKP